MDSHQATVDGIPMRWEESGEGPPVVLLHGIPTSPALWRYVTPLLADVRVLAFELVGYGHSIPAGRDRDIGLAAQARYVASWMRHLSLDRAVLVGHDLGGGVAQILAVRDPGRCAGLVLTNAVSYDSWPIPAVEAMRAASEVVARLPSPLLRLSLSSLFVRAHDDLRLAREALDVHTAPYAQHDGAAALARQASSLDNRDTMAIAGRLPDVQVPTRIVWGVADQFQTPDYAQRLARDLGTRPWAIRGGKHFTPEDHPRTVAGAIREVVVTADAA